ncbi:hypothetical protein VRY85_07920 [Achromobacter sp. F4_2707]|uniref:hypothetical protein n=1 Tax=Achromobacter sp. F4_2707 TaxID=3114286 RepID=UPI0039C743FF
MSETATWSTQATPLASVAGAVVLTLGAFSIVFAALTLALGGAPWSFSAYACLALTAVWVALRLHRAYHHKAYNLSRCPGGTGFFVQGVAERLELAYVWQGPGWVTLGLRYQAPPHRVLRLVIWKSAIPAPLWSELALCIEAGPLQENSHQNKENP